MFFCLSVYAFGRVFKGEIENFFQKKVAYLLPEKTLPPAGVYPVALIDKIFAVKALLLLLA
jgi:hypothetical protein